MSTYEHQKHVIVGKVNFRNDTRPVKIKDKDRLCHIYCLGKSGVGKSTLLLNMAIQDTYQGNGFCIIDPHGDIAENILDYIPEDRLEDVIYFNPADTEHPIAFNPLKNVHPAFFHLVAGGLISTFKKIWSDNWGPRLEHILRFSLLALLEYREASLLDIQPLLTDPAYRKQILARVTDHSVLSFWQNEFEKFSNSLRAEAVSPILNKLGIFASSPLLRNIMGQKERRLHFQKMMDDEKILIVNLSKGKVGEDVSALLGSMIVTQLQLAALYRANQPEHTRRPFYLYIDECHSFITDSIAGILSEARKYGLGLFLTHQYIDQLPEDMQSAIFGNVGTLIAFRVGNADAEILAKEFHPMFTEYDIINLPRHSIYLKLMIDGATSQPFSAITLPLPISILSNKERIIELCRARFGRPKSYVEDEIKVRYGKRKEQGRLFE
jgi:hypothetical protein